MKTKEEDIMDRNFSTQMYRDSYKLHIYSLLSIISSVYLLPV